MELVYCIDLPQKDSLFKFYDQMGWNETLNLTPESLYRAMENSWYSIYAYDNNELVATGRVVSDGIINAYICGLGVIEKYRNKGVGSLIFKELIQVCEKEGLYIQFMCEEHLKLYYEKLGCTMFACGMKK